MKNYTPRALIVDDDLGVSRLMKRCLSLWGWEADESHTVSAALGLFQQGRYDLALCDIDLPDGNGISLAKALSKTKPLLRVVMVSGSPANVRLARGAGFDRCLHKPFELNELKALIDTPTAAMRRARSLRHNRNST